jgi:hypothetical protein
MHKTSLIVWRGILIAILALLNLSPSWTTGWSYDGELLIARSMFQAGQNSIEDSFSAEIDGKVFCLRSVRAGMEITGCGAGEAELFWQSPPEWDVREGYFSDLNRDGEKEVTLLVWRPFQPWPVDRFLPSGGRINSFQDSMGRSCQIILLGWEKGDFREVWAGSAMANPLHQIHSVDLDADGFEELAGLEYEYDGNEQSVSIVVWEWNGFGFSIGDRINGSFSTIVIMSDSQGFLLAAQ